MLAAVALAISGATDPSSFIRINQVGYLPDARKVAVICSLDSATFDTFKVVDARGRTVLGPAQAVPSGSFAACRSTFRLDFTTIRKEGTYTVVAGSVRSPSVRISARAFAGAADTLLYYMRQQRSGFNPLARRLVHQKDGIIVDDSARNGEFINVSGGWHDASDYLQYVTTSANATYVMLMAHRDFPNAFTDKFDSLGLPGRNGRKDVLDEAAHGLEWMSRMFPGDGLMFNQLADDRDHAGWDVPWNDSSNYGWGRGGYRPVYPCTGKPQGLLRFKNRSTGLASTAGKYASTFALGAASLRNISPAFSRKIAAKAAAAYDLGVKSPGVCQTAPAGAPYFYEEDNWADDMELGAVQLFALTGSSALLRDAMMYADKEPVTPWMGADTARHYQWFPWHNNAHYEIWRVGNAAQKKQVAEYYRRGLAAVVARAGNGFKVGIPFIWCSNNLMASFATQAYLYRRMTGDNQFREFEQAAIDWLLGTNPWGVSMIIGYPRNGRWAADPHSVIAKELHQVLTGGLLDGPVYRSIYQNLKGISLHNSDEFSRFNSGFIVYHDDVGDYSTNEPIMDGTANLTYLFAALAPNR
jgi:hypothetical protein